MEVYMLCPDGRNRPEIFIPQKGYLYFSDLADRDGANPYEGVAFYNACYIRMGKHPVYNTPIADDRSYQKIELADEPITLVMQMLVKRDELLKRRSAVGGDAVQQQHVSQELEELERDLMEPLRELREMTGTVGRI